MCVYVCVYQFPRDLMYAEFDIPAAAVSNTVGTDDVISDLDLPLWNFQRGVTRNRDARYLFVGKVREFDVLTCGVGLQLDNFGINSAFT